MADPISRLNAALAGRYTIERQLGEGGMATVYLADDLRHSRKVALKVLKPELAAVIGAERFLAEIKTTANLQHPHILPLFDSGEADTFLFYVMPYVEGETLREKIDRERQLAVGEAVSIATKVAGALQAAHERGVIHRDIKPANILLSNGEPLVSDFGIALAVTSGGAGRLTETGLSLGTPHYMSPEQATGDMSVGAATDIYALGCVLYEMLVGEPPYTGSTPQAVLGKIVTGDADPVTKHRRTAPPNVDGAIRKALEKVPADRFGSAGELARELGDAGFRHGVDAVAAGGASARQRRVAIAGWAAAAAMAAVAVALAIGSPEPGRDVERFPAPFLEGQAHIGYEGFSGSDLSPDGSMLVYRFNDDGGQILMVRRWDDLAATPVRETLSASAPAVSFDGLELAFEQDEDVKVLAFSGGPVRTLLAGSQPEWGPDGYVYATTDAGTVRVPSTGGAVEVVSRRGERESAHLVRDVLPDGRRALLEVAGGDGTRQIHGVDLRTGETTFIVDGQLPRYVSTGHLVYYLLNGTMMAARFDPRRMELLGTPVAVVDGIAYFSLADDGTLYYVVGSAVTGSSGPVRRLAWVTRTGEASAVDPAWTFFQGPDGRQGLSLSPDGSRVALSEFTEGGYDIWIKRLDSGPRSRLTFDESEEKMSVWEPGGANVTYLSNRNGNFDVWSKPADGTGEPELLVDLDVDLFRIDWSPDGEWLLLQTTDGDVLGYRPGETAEPIPLLAEPYRELEPAVSPDGRWLAYTSAETGTNQVYVRPFPGVNAGRWQVSSQTGRFPRWARSGRELYFQESRSDGPMWVVEVQPGPSFAFGAPVLLFESPGQWAGGALTGNPYDVAPGDQRFLIAGTGVTVGGEGLSRATTVLVKNFFEELERLVPE